MKLPIIQDNDDKTSSFKNCIRNNYRHIRKWGERTNTNCFRIYDRDIKEFPVAIDFYAGRFCVHYFTFPGEGDEPREDLRDAVETTLFALFQAKPSSIYARTRMRREKVEQYEKTGESKEFFEVLEYGVKFWINLSDYLDTGLFLDHRETRRYVASIAQGKRVLNLFAYTCSFSVHAAVAGALSTKSVDLSNTYTAWGKDNFLLNHISLHNHHILRDDCLQFLEYERGVYDLIIIDPPTISRSKKMERMFDVQEDYIFLISSALRLLSQDGKIIFSTNLREFVFDETRFSNAHILDVSRKTIPLDFRNPKIHRCWLISHR
jgi:23S rRNA G2069 N7-methylase RlmK/C1962 C5-methylase RlmI